ncbi:unnamed protein product [Ostreobium quekettii]|uniref:Uncharacterized protein n=1 Tax=Ostreobium quekettii TaxID=121088 RepID=A0A8S1ISX2_9CHLO|nr:unnamed protein product [Ostreobium quekettii]
MEMLPLDVGNVLLEDVVKRHGKRLSPAMIAAFKECASRIALDGWGASHGGGQWLAEIAQYRHLTSLKMNNCSLSHKAKSNYLYLLEGLADKLITLHLQRCGCFTQSALHHISQCHKLQDLDLSGQTNLMTLAAGMP